MENQILNIRGMTCAVCVQRIEKIIGKLPGISSVTVNLATEKAAVTYTPQMLDIPNFIVRPLDNLL